MLNPWRLNLLSQLASLGTVRAVADLARMSPSSVSQQLAVLEREARTPLLERAGRRVRLTPAGVALVKHARVILDQMDAAQAEVVSLDGAPAGRVRVGAFTSALNTFVITAARRLESQFPRLRLDVWELDPLDSQPALLRGECDVIVTADFIDGSVPIDPGVARTPLVDDLVVVVGSARHAGLPDGPAELADLASRRWATEMPGTWTHELVTRSCRRAGFEPDVTGVFASYGSLLSHVEAGLSITLLPELAVDRRYDVATRPLRRPLRRSITAGVRRSSTGRPAVDAVLAALREAAGHDAVPHV